MVRPRRGSDCSISVRRRFLFSLPLLVWRLHIHFSLFTLCFFFFFSFFVSTERYKLLIVLALAARCLVLSRRLTPSSSRDFRLLDDFSQRARAISKIETELIPLGCFSLLFLFGCLEWFERFWSFEDNKSVYLRIALAFNCLQVSIYIYYNVK